MKVRNRTSNAGSQQSDNQSAVLIATMSQERTDASAAAFSLAVIHSLLLSGRVARNSGSPGSFDHKSALPKPLPSGKASRKGVRRIHIRQKPATLGVRGATKMVGVVINAS